jgi:hypothetical protein
MQMQMQMQMMKEEEEEKKKTAMMKSASDTIKVEVEQEFLNQDSITIPIGDVKPGYPIKAVLFPAPLAGDDDDDTPVKKPIKQQKKKKTGPVVMEDDEEELDDGFEIQRQLFASFEGKDKKERRKYGNAKLYYEEDVQEDKELRRVAPAKAELRPSRAALRDDLGRHYFVPDAKKHSYAKDIILTAMDEYGDDPRYGFYWVTLAPNEHEYPNIDDVLRVRQNGKMAKGKQKKKDWFTAHVTKIQGDKDRRQGKRSTSWAVLKI